MRERSSSSLYFFTSYSIYIYMPDHSVIQPGYEFEHTRLTAAGTANYCRHLARTALKTYILQYRFICSRIGEGHMVEHYACTLCALLRRICAALNAALGVEYFGDALGAGVAHWEEHDNKREHHYRG